MVANFIDLSLSTYRSVIFEAHGCLSDLGNHLRVMYVLPTIILYVLYVLL